jgi:carbon-monoxide dehydrogenase small subunit
MQDKQSAGDPVSLSRRRFLAGAGVVLSGSVVGSGLLFSACTASDSNKTITLTNEKPRYVCPYDGKTFDNFEQLTQYISQNYPGQQPVTRFVSPYDNKEFSSLEELKAYLDNMFAGSKNITLNVNGTVYTLQAKASWSLSFVIREKLGLTGTKIGCSRGSCGACTVIIDGKAVLSCLVLAVEATEKHITTIEGISNGIQLHPVQQAFVNNNAAQCGYCTPGFIMSAKALLDNQPSPSRDELREALSGHLCICGHTKKIVDAVLFHTPKV